MRKPTVSALALALTSTAAPALAGAHMADAALCENAFTTVDADESARITPETAREASAGEFRAIDVDESGALTRDEFVACMGKAAGSATAEVDRGAETLEPLDADGDGAVSVEEFMQASDAAYARVRGVDPEVADAEAARRLIFSPTPVTGAELSAMGPTEFGTRSALLFLALDVNADREVSREEWEAAEVAMPDISEVLNREFEAMDSDASGEVTPDEFEAWQMASFERTLDRMTEAEAADAPVIYYRHDLYMPMP